MASTAMLWSQSPFHGLGTGLTSFDDSASHDFPYDGSVAAFMQLVELQTLSTNNFARSQNRVTFHSDRVIELNDVDDSRRHACDICGRRFPLAKTLYRHRRSLHSFSNASKLNLKCTHCGLQCKRKDILDRHVRERHAELEDKVKCRLCGKKIGRRSYNNHQKSSACKKSKPWDDTNSRQMDLFIRPRSETNVRVSTPVYLDAIADPVMLAAELFVRFKPWGPDNGWLNPFHHPDTAPLSESIEVMQLKDVLLGTIIRAMSSPYVSRDPSIVDALAILLIFIVQAMGWTASRVHTQGFVMLAAMQIEAAQSEAQFVDTTAGDVFHTVVLRNVADPEVSRCEDMIKMAIALMRYAAAENIRFMNLKVANKGQPEWDTVLEIDPNWWFEYYRPKLLPIAEVASTLNRNTPM